MYASINIGAMGIFSLVIPETKGRSLEEMDIIFGVISLETRRRDIERERAAFGGIEIEDLSLISSHYKVGT